MNDKALREHVDFLLGGGGAHLHFDRAVAGLPRYHPIAVIARLDRAIQ